MKFIYAEAQLVWAWVGAGMGGSKAVYDFIEEVVALPLESFDNYTRFAHSVPIRYGSTIWKALAEFIRCPYWGRLWIIQELFSGNTEVKSRCFRGCSRLLSLKCICTHSSVRKLKIHCPMSIHFS